jgi:uncharacterized membrane protein
MSTSLLVLTAFLASAVEMVEALTIILAVGLTRGWRSALIGAAAGLVVLAVVVAALGPALVRVVPLAALQIVVGALLLIFGLQWLRKAILRASGLKAKHDEALVFQHELVVLGEGPPVDRAAIDWTGFTVAFKGMFLEGLEVAFIVLTFGLQAGRFGPSVAGALAAFVVDALVGIAVHRPLTRAPENGIKFAVGIALTTFGTFWAGEGIGVEWPAGDVTLLILAVIYALVAAAFVAWLRASERASMPPLPKGESA